MNIYLFKHTAGEQCLARLRAILGPTTARLEEQRYQGCDYALLLDTRPPLKLGVEFKQRIATRTQAMHLVLQLRARAAEGAAIVFAEWIPEGVADEFRKAGIYYVDTCGNVFIRKPPRLIVDIRGNKPDRPAKAEPGRIIEPGGLKVLHFLLTHPNAAKETLRAIAEGADVALGTAHAVIRELQREQWLLPGEGDRRRFGDLKGLAELFVRGYALKLRPACYIGRFRHRLRPPQEILQAFGNRLKGHPRGWALTGGIAARQLTQYLEPDMVAIFVDQDAEAVIRQEPMLRDEANGNVTLLRLFGRAAIGHDQGQPWPLATPLLVYAELLEAGRPRELETAQMVYERYLEPQLAHGT